MYKKLIVWVILLVLASSIVLGSSNEKKEHTDVLRDHVRQLLDGYEQKIDIVRVEGTPPIGFKKNGILIYHNLFGEN